MCNQTGEYRMELFDRIDLNQKTINKERPFQGTLLTELRNYFRIGLTWSSNALEGNTLTESETKVLLEDGITVGGKPLRDTLEALGHAKSYDYMFGLLQNRSIKEQDVLTLHKLFYHQIDEENAGKYRSTQVVITGSKYSVCKPSLIQTEMNRLLQWIQTKRDQYHPVEFSARLHLRFVYIHPFIDGNGRIARLLLNTVLLQDKYLPAIIPTILRQEYINLLEKSHTNAEPFIAFIAQRVLESQKEIMRLLHIPQPSSGR